MPDIIDAYLATNYVVLAPDGDVTLRIGEMNAAFATLMRGFGASSAVVLTAWNPRSATLSREENDARQGQLLAECSERVTLPAEGRRTLGDWPPETSLCVFDLPFDEACRLADVYGQTAFVAVDARGLAWLVTRPPG
jgi:hypothetical protein